MDACLLGVIYAKFSNPSSRQSSILFSDKGVITKSDGKLWFMFRIANMRSHQMMWTKLRAWYCADAESAEGEEYIRFDEVKVNTDNMVFFPGYPFLVMHEIDDDSPLKGLSRIAEDTEILVVLEATDTATSNQTQVRYSYTASEIVFGGEFTDIVLRLPNGTIQVDYSRFHEIDRPSLRDAVINEAKEEEDE